MDFWKLSLIINLSNTLEKGSQKDENPPSELFIDDNLRVI